MKNTITLEQVKSASDLQSYMEYATSGKFKTETLSLDDGMHIEFRASWSTPKIVEYCGRDRYETPISWKEAYNRLNERARLNGIYTGNYSITKH